jgi:hypothetical protein
MCSAWTFAAAAIGLALVLASVERGLAADVGPFDGIWSVEVNCPSLGDAEGYHWSFPAEVSSGFMSGLYRSETSSAMGHITGASAPTAKRF